MSEIVSRHSDLDDWQAFMGLLLRFSIFEISLFEVLRPAVDV